MEIRKEGLSGSEKSNIFGEWPEGKDRLGNKTWSFQSAAGTGLVTDEGTTIFSRRNGARFRADATPTDEPIRTDFKWTLPDAQAWIFRELGFRTEEFNKQQTIEAMRTVRNTDID